MTLRGPIKLNEQRTSKAFALFPTEMADHSIVWLERYNVTKEYYRGAPNGDWCWSVVKKWRIR